MDLLYSKPFLLNVIQLKEQFIYYSLFVHMMLGPVIKIIQLISYRERNILRYESTAYHIIYQATQYSGNCKNGKTIITVRILCCIKKLLISCKYRRSFDLPKDMQNVSFLSGIFHSRLFRVNTITFATRELSADFS